MRQVSPRERCSPGRSSEDSSVGGYKIVFSIADARHPAWLSAPKSRSRGTADEVFRALPRNSFAQNDCILAGAGKAGAVRDESAFARTAPKAAPLQVYTSGLHFSCAIVTDQNITSAARPPLCVVGGQRNARASVQVCDGGQQLAGQTILGDEGVYQG